MVTFKILKRKDAASVVTAIVLGLIVYGFVSAISQPLAYKISSSGSASPGNWHNQYLLPLVLVILELVLLEIVNWVYVGFKTGFKQK